MKRYILLSACLLFTACSTTTAVKVDSYSNYAAIPNGFSEKATFSIHPMHHTNPLFAQETTHKIRYSLEQRGYTVLEPEAAEYRLHFEVTPKTVSETILVDEKIPEPPEETWEWVKDENGKMEHKKFFKASYKIVKKPQIYTYSMEECSMSVYKAADSKNPIWRGTASCKVRNIDDLREHLDYLLTPLFTYFGSSTKRQITVNLKEKDLL
ncbi:MAG: DUF4136 domain-containing protein [Verrucomicrobia bacterium]|nr:DUF4136 domain-containing protein [Verrucomicrobiota bacterium]